MRAIEIRQVELVRDRARTARERQDRHTRRGEELASVVGGFGHKRQRQAAGWDGAGEVDETAAIAIGGDARDGEVPFNLAGRCASVVGRIGEVSRECPSHAERYGGGKERHDGLGSEPVLHVSRSPFALAANRCRAVPVEPVPVDRPQEKRSDRASSRERRCEISGIVRGATRNPGSR